MREGIIAFKCGFYLVNNYMSIVIVTFIPSLNMSVCYIAVMKVKEMLCVSILCT